MVWLNVLGRNYICSGQIYMYSYVVLPGMEKVSLLLQRSMQYCQYNDIKYSIDSIHHEDRCRLNLISSSLPTLFDFRSASCDTVETFFDLIIL